MKWYILDGRTPVEEPDVAKWNEWFTTANRTVRKDKATVTLGGDPIGLVEVSTVFLGLDHAYGFGPPILFESMIFGGPLDGDCDRCSTWDAAEQMHEKMMERVIYSAKTCKTE